MKIKNFFQNFYRIVTRKIASNNSIVDLIIDIEKEWFVAIKAENSDCQENPEAFSSMRKMFFTPLSINTLKEYLDHISYMQKIGRNLMIEKYSIMNGRLNVRSYNNLIDEIVSREKNWFIEMKEKFPALFSSQPIEYFENYLKSELITYSDKTVENYWNDVLNAINDNRNFAKERQEFLVKFLGYNSIEEMSKNYEK